MEVQSSHWFSNNTWSTLAQIIAWRRLAPSHPLGHNKATIHITYNGLVMKKVCCLIAFMHICIKSWYFICMESVYLMKSMIVYFKWYHYMCHMSCIHISIFRGISNNNEWTTEVWLFNKCENSWYSSHILIFNASLWKLQLLIRSSLTVTSIGLSALMG